MAQRESRQDSDGVTWSPASVRVGQAGIDLRRPAEPPALSDLLNARFLDEITVARRGGYVGRELRDNSPFPGGRCSPDPTNWLYGHGHVVGVSSIAGNPPQPAPQCVHYPIYLRGQATLRQDGTDAVWTGDRLLVPQGGGRPSVGSSAFWARSFDQAAGRVTTQRGVPAHLPLVTEQPAPNSVGGDWVTSCLTATTRVLVSIKSNAVTATTLDRATGQVLDQSDVTQGAAAPAEPTVVNSGGIPCVLHRNPGDSSLRLLQWGGTGWTLVSTFAGVLAYDVAAVAGGFYLAWRTAGGVFVGQFAGGATITNVNLTFATQLSPAETPTGDIALGVAPGGALGLAYLTATPGVGFTEFLPWGAPTSFSVPSSRAGMQLNTLCRGLSVCSRALYCGVASAPGTNYLATEWVLHTGDDSGTVRVVSFSALYPTQAGTTSVGYAQRFQSDLLSRGFVVGDEVFAWVRSRTSGSAYLLCGATAPYVAGFADREVALVPKLPGAFLYWPARVASDPSYGFGFTWARSFNVGSEAGLPGVSSGDHDFLPLLSSAVFGRSSYTSGSCPKNWDGLVLRDAGFADFPVISGGVQSAGGGLTLTSVYQWRAYATMHNLHGERFESAAVTFTDTLTGANRNEVLTIQVPPGVSTTDVTIEVYRTVAGGTTFYLEGTVAGPNTSSTVTFTSTMSDAILLSQKADPHATGVGNLSVIESFAPLGCAFLAVAGDRLWGGGGQVQAGQVQFSLLKSPGFAAGFDALGGYYQVDNEGGAVTSVAALDDSTAIFELNRVYEVGGQGPDNFGNGGYGAPTLAMAAGAVNHFGTCLVQGGVLYYSSAGPQLLSRGRSVTNVSAPVRTLAAGLSPIGVQVDTARQEVVWHLQVARADGQRSQALLLNYAGQAPRWARWDLPAVAGCSPYAHVTQEGRLCTESASAQGDDGTPFAFLVRSASIRAGRLLEGYTQIRMLGLLGQWQGKHQLRFRAYFDGAPLWSEEEVWDTTGGNAGTFLTLLSDVQGNTAAQQDAVTEQLDRSGGYSIAHRMRRQTCHYAQVEVSDVSNLGPSFTPFELTFELGDKPGLGRVPTSNFTGLGR